MSDINQQYTDFDEYIRQGEQVEYKHGTSTGQVQDKLPTDNANIKRLIIVIGNQELSVKSMMDALELKGRDNFQNLYLKPAISEGYVRLLYPNSPHHPRQKYLLTVKGLTLQQVKVKFLPELAPRRRLAEEIPNWGNH